MNIYSRKILLLCLSLLLVACQSDDTTPEPLTPEIVLRVMPEAMTLEVGTTGNLDVTFEGPTALLAAGLGYNSSDFEIATVSREGVVTAVSEGTVVVRVTSFTNQDIFDHSLITVVPSTRPLITSFSASPSIVTLGDATTLSWDISGDVDSVTITPDVAFTGNSANKSVTVSPSETTTYTLTASSEGGFSEASVEVTVLPTMTEVCQGDYLVTNQAELTALSNCNVITGFLSIDQSDDIVDLTALANLSQIGSLNIGKNDALESLTGLENLTTITESLTIGGQQGIVELSTQQMPFLGSNLLESLQGLNNLERVGGDVSIGFNDALTTLAGLENLETIGGRLDVFESPSLMSLAGLNALNSVGGSVSIYDNAVLETFMGLDALTEIGGNLDIFRNDALVSFTSLDNLERIGGDLSINFNASLTSLAGLEALESIGGDLSIHSHTSLTSLAAIASLTDDDIGGRARIFGNDNLDCAVQNLQFTVVGVCN